MLVTGGGTISASAGGIVPSVVTTADEYAECWSIACDLSRHAISSAIWFTVSGVPALNASTTRVAR